MRKNLVNSVYNLKLLEAYGEEVFISGNVEIIRPNLIRVGSHVMIDSYFFCTTSLDLGNYIHIGSHTGVIGGEVALLKMGHFTGISMGGRLICGSDDFTDDFGLMNPTIPANYHRKLKILPIVFEDFATIGTNVTVMPGVTLREGSLVGAGSVVLRDTEPWTLYAGNPAKPIRSLSKVGALDAAAKLGYPWRNGS